MTKRSFAYCNELDKENMKNIQSVGDAKTLTDVTGFGI
jgi:selenophosphate synthase